MGEFERVRVFVRGGESERDEMMLGVLVSLRNDFISNDFKVLAFVNFFVVAMFCFGCFVYLLFLKFAMF